MELINNGQSGSAIPKLQAAISQKSVEGANIKFYGMKFGDYFPHYYLGMAYFSQKNYDAALRELELSERQGAIQKKANLYDKLSNIKTLAKANLVVKDQPQVAQNQPPIVQPVPQNPPIQQPPKEDSKPDQVTQNKQPQPPAEEIKVVQNQDNKSSVQPDKQPDKKPDQIVSVVPDKKPPPIAPIVEPDPNSNVRKTMLRNGARKYFEGDFDGAILFLVEVQKLSPGDTPVDFLLGCSYASKYLLTGSQNKQFLDSASLLFRRVKKLNPRYQPKNKTFFSPAVLQIYEKTT